MMRVLQRGLIFLLLAGATPCSLAQSEQRGANPEARALEKLRLEYLHYRPARWNTDQITEYESEFPNQGGMLTFYLRNVSDKPVSLRFWRFNKRDESYWVLNHFVAWHRWSRRELAPGELAVLEICAISRDFGLGVPYIFEAVDESWEPCISHAGTLEEEAVEASFIQFRPGLQEVDLHLRAGESGKATLRGLQVEGAAPATFEWRAPVLEQRGQTIGRMHFDTPLAAGSLFVVSVDLDCESGPRRIFTHRNVFEDFYPIGTWGITPETQEFLQKDYVDTVIQGGRKQDLFFSETAPRMGFRAMVHTGEPVNVDMVRDLSAHANVVCWMLRDEPDWSVAPDVMLFCNDTIRAHDRSKPTFLNLCRNTKFFEYAAIADIAGHDHYCVTAPSSSKWPKPYGTLLEETAIYTEDLRFAAAPRPVWVWSQGNHDGWSERLLRPVPTAEELSAQLVLNVGRGAKGILWFTYNAAMSEKYPDTRAAMRGWNKVLHLLRGELLGAEPLARQPEAPAKVDAAGLVSWNTLLLWVANLDYDLDPKAYVFRPKTNVELRVEAPSWIHPAGITAFDARGRMPAEFEQAGARIVVKLPELRDGAVIVLSTQPGAIEENLRLFEAMN